MEVCTQLHNQKEKVKCRPTLHTPRNLLVRWWLQLARFCQLRNRVCAIATGFCEEHPTHAQCRGSLEDLLLCLDLWLYLLHVFILRNLHLHLFTNGVDHRRGCISTTKGRCQPPISRRRGNGCEQGGVHYKGEGGQPGLGTGRDDIRLNSAIGKVALIFFHEVLYNVRQLAGLVGRIRQRLCQVVFRMTYWIA